MDDHDRGHVQPHIRLRPGDIPPYVLLPGDPGRIDHIARLLNDPREVASNREYRTVVGRLPGGLEVAATSTGIGGPGAAIAIEELVRCGAHTLLRVGSAGALQPGIAIGDLVVPSGAVREDGASETYIDTRYPAVAHPDVLAAIREAGRGLGLRLHVGIARSHDSFYTDDQDEVTAYWHRRGVLASDMETATLFVVGGLRGARCGSILNVVVPYQGSLEQGIGGLVEAEAAAFRGEEDEIRLALAALARLAGST